LFVLLARWVGLVWFVSPCGCLVCFRGVCWGGFGGGGGPKILLWAQVDIKKNPVRLYKNRAG